jgi:hypothetical protein
MHTAQRPKQQEIAPSQLPFKVESSQLPPTAVQALAAAAAAAAVRQPVRPPARRQRARALPPNCLLPACWSELLLFSRSLFELIEQFEYRYEVIGTYPGRSFGFGTRPPTSSYR